MKDILDFLRRGLDETNTEALPKIASGLILVGAGLLFNAMLPAEKYPEERRRAA